MRLVVLQPLIASYRVPLFEKLGQLPGVTLQVYAGKSLGSLRAHGSGAHYTYSPAPVRSLPFGFRVQWAQVWSAMGKADLIIAPWDVHYLTLWPLIAAGRVTRTTVALWGHGYSKDPHPATDWVRNLCGRAADAVLLYSQGPADQLVELHGYLRNRVFVAPNALDQAPIQKARSDWLSRPVDLRQFQASRQIDPTHTLIFVSRLEPENSIDVLLRAIPPLAALFPALKVLVVGGGSDEARLRRVAHELNVDDYLIWAGPIYSEAELAPWMLSATLFCYPTQIGLSILHAFGYGLPVITGDDPVAQNPEAAALREGINGKQFRSGNWQHLAEVCSSLLRDPAVQSKMSAAAHSTAVNDFSMDRMVAGFQSLIDFSQNHRRR